MEMASSSSAPLLPSCSIVGSSSSDGQARARSRPRLCSIGVGKDDRPPVPVGRNHQVAALPRCRGRHAAWTASPAQHQAATSVAFAASEDDSDDDASGEDDDGVDPEVPAPWPAGDVARAHAVSLGEALTAAAYAGASRLQKEHHGK